MNNKKSTLFSELKIKDVTLKNRIAVSPMCMYSSQDGFANHWHMVHIGSRAVGGAGAIIMEAAGVAPEARITPDDLGIWKDKHIDKLKEIVSFAESQGAVMGIQLAHAGRKASTASPWKRRKVLPKEAGGWQPLAPSAIPFQEGETPPQAMTKKEIEALKAHFKSAAIRAQKAGFKIIEIHAAHGYLLHQFLSPLSNQRKDEYGGSFENRIRLTLEVVEAVTEVWPENLAVFVRISATDWAAGGWTPEESVKLAKILKDKGVDLIDCSSGGLIPNAQIPVEKSYQVQFAEKIRTEANILTGAVGLITQAEEAENIIATQKSDLVFMAREFLRNPYFPLQAAKTLNAEISWPVQYERAKKKTEPFKFS